MADACNHCQLPVGRLGYRRQINGLDREFCCYGCYLAFQIGSGEFEDADVARLLIRLGTGVFLAMNIMLFSLLIYSGVLDESDPKIYVWVTTVMALLATPLMVVLGGPFIASAANAARSGRVNGDTLVSVGTIAAYSYSVIAIVKGYAAVYFDTVAMVLLLFTVGRLLEAIGRAKAVRSLQPMFAAENATACVINGDIEESLPIAQVFVGDSVLVGPGELVPVDGIVLEGRSECDESVLTGEPLAVAKREGSKVHAGSINISGRLLVETVLVGSATRWGMICQRVRAAMSTESKIQHVLDRVADIFVPFVLLLAIAVTWYWSGRVDLAEALMTGLAVLVVACPCALGLAAPLAGMLGLKKATLGGCLVRSSRVLEAMSAVSRVAIDKTGTLTEGRGRLVDISSSDCDEDLMIQVAAGAESRVHHPLARAIREVARARKLPPVSTSALREWPGLGVTAGSDIGKLAVGSAKLFDSLGWVMSSKLLPHPIRAGEDPVTRIYVGWDGSVRGSLGFADTVLPEAEKMITALRELGLETCILSGDSEKVTASVALDVGADHWRAELTPEDKQAVLKEWLEPDNKVAMVGDGLNDAPVLAEASVGIAVGGATDLARETSDITLPVDGLMRLPWLFSLSRRVQKTIYQNLFWALSYNAIGLLLAATGILQPIAAAALMAGSSILIVVNSLRLERFPSHAS